MWGVANGVNSACRKCLGLRGSNGSCDHAVVLCEGWIFDGAHEMALELCKENLDVCCSSGIVEVTFIGFERMYLLIEYRPGSQKRLAKGGERYFCDKPGKPRYISYSGNGIY